VIFNRTLGRLDLVNMMQSGRFVITPELAGDPRITSKGVESAVYHWRIAVPLKLTLKSADRTLDRQIVAHARVTREPLEAHPEGIAIDSLNFLPVNEAGG
jgi:hypothetical protein